MEKDSASKSDVVSKSEATKKNLADDPKYTVATSLSTPACNDDSPRRKEKEEMKPPTKK